jgi:hypothetical protein
MATRFQKECSYSLDNLIKIKTGFGVFYMSNCPDLVAIKPVDMGKDTAYEATFINGSLHERVLFAVSGDCDLPGKITEEIIDKYYSALEGVYQGTYTTEEAKPLTAEDVEKAIASLSINPRIQVVVIGVHVHKTIKSMFKESLKGNGVYGGVPCFLVFSAGGEYCKILDISANATFENAEKYLQNELKDLSDKEYQNVLDYFKRRLNR